MKLKTLPFFLLLAMTFGLSGFEKLITFEIPTWFTTQFQGSLLDLLPGQLTGSFILIGGMEIATMLLVTLGLLLNRKSYLNYGVILAQVTFVALGFGQRLTHKFDEAGFLFFYSALTFIAGRFALADD